MRVSSGIFGSMVWGASIFWAEETSPRTRTICSRGNNFLGPWCGVHPFLGSWCGGLGLRSNARRPGVTRRSDPSVAAGKAWASRSLGIWLDVWGLGHVVWNATDLGSTFRVERPSFRVEGIARTPRKRVIASRRASTKFPYHPRITRTTRTSRKASSRSSRSDVWHDTNTESTSEHNRMSTSRAVELYRPACIRADKLSQLSKPSFHQPLPLPTPLHPLPLCPLPHDASPPPTPPRSPTGMCECLAFFPPPKANNQRSLPQLFPPDVCRDRERDSPLARSQVRRLAKLGAVEYSAVGGTS